MEMKTPEILVPASRQYQHNNCNGMLAGFDHGETVKIVNLLNKTIKAQARLLADREIGRLSPEWVFDSLRKAQKAGLEV